MDNSNSGPPLQVVCMRRRIKEYDHHGYPTGAWHWGAWEALESQRFLKAGADMQARLSFWRDLNDYAIKERGESARCEFKLVDDSEVHQ